MMSGEEESDIMMCCASCGIGQVDDIKLKKCTACFLVRYCSRLQYCKYICDIDGCLDRKCPFCRQPTPDSDEEARTKRIKANDPVATLDMGLERQNEGDYESAHRYYTKSAALGDAQSHYQLSCLYREGKDVIKTRKKKFIIWKRLLLVGTLMLGTILVASR
eukprot:scaffold19204_cov66-Skeletonema_marinoi.AAC.1